MPFDLEKAEEFIRQHIPITQPGYIHEGEETVLNPHYEDISHNASHLRQGEIRIWALRGDMILATGIKNAYQNKFGYREFNQTFFNQQHHLNIYGRYGHPSLTYSENNDVGAYYAGYLKLDANRLQVYLASGRFFTSDYTNEQVKILEEYIAHLFCQAYGVNSIIFYHGMKDYKLYKSNEDYYRHLGLFFKLDDLEELAGEPQRHYQPI